MAGWVIDRGSPSCSAPRPHSAAGSTPWPPRPSGSWRWWMTSARPRRLRLAGAAGGNPLYLTELVDALTRSRALVVKDGMVDAAEGPTPDSLSAAIAHRLEFLAAPTRAVIRAAALLGLDFSVSELA